MSTMRVIGALGFSVTLGLFVWSMNGEPKAMAGYSGLTPQSVRLNMVYSPLANRRQGFATNLVAQLSSYLLNKGWLSCVLFADKQNLVSNRLYEKIGYQPISDFLELNLLGSQLMQTSH